MRYVFALLLALPLLAAAKPSPVVVGAYINDIQNLDLKSHSYGVDIYLWFRWRDKVLDPPASMEFVNPFDLWGHTKTLEFPRALDLPTGEHYQIVRNLGRFSTKLALYEYPFDEQQLLVEIEDSRMGSQELEYVADENAISINPELRLPGFRIARPRLEVVPHTYPTTFGDPRENASHVSSRIKITVPIERPILTYSVKLLIPVLCVIFTAALMFLFNPSYVDARTGIGVTALLTIVALQITLNEDLPEVDYLVLMDKIYLASYLFVIAALGMVVKTTWMLERGASPVAVQWNRKALVVLTTLYLAATAVIVLLSWC